MSPLSWLFLLVSLFFETKLRPYSVTDIGLDVATPFLQSSELLLLFLTLEEYSMIFVLFLFLILTIERMKSHYALTTKYF